jgi:hypothetical protein
MTELSAALHIRDYKHGFQLAGAQLTLWNIAHKKVPVKLSRNSLPFYSVL